MNVGQADWKKVAFTDYWASLGWIAPLTVWAMFLLVYFLNSRVDMLLLWICLGVTVTAPVLLVWRYSMIASVFGMGSEVPGHISQVGFYRGRGRVVYTYTYLGEKLESGNAVQSNGATRNLQIGQAVTVVVDRENPKRAFLKALYASTEGE